MDDITFLLGEIKGNQEAQGRQIDKIEGQLRETNANVGKIAKVCAERGHIIEQVEQHMEIDTPVDVWVGSAAVKILLAIGHTAQRYQLCTHPAQVYRCPPTQYICEPACERVYQ